MFQKDDCSLLYYLLLFQTYVGVVFGTYLFYYALHSVFSSFAIISLRKRELVALLEMSSCDILDASIMWLSLGCHSLALCM